MAQKIHGLARLGPGLHGRATGHVQHTGAGTTGALAALGQDAPARGEWISWEVGNVAVKCCEHRKHRKLVGSLSQFSAQNSMKFLPLSALLMAPF